MNLNLLVPALCVTTAVAVAAAQDRPAATAEALTGWNSRNLAPISNEVLRVKLPRGRRRPGLRTIDGLCE